MSSGLVECALNNMVVVVGWVSISARGDGTGGGAVAVTAKLKGNGKALAVRRIDDLSESGSSADGLAIVKLRKRLQSWKGVGRMA